MNRRDLLTTACRAAPCVLLTTASGQSSTTQQYSGFAEQRESLKQTGDAIRSAFARGDVAGILAYHHPEVIKALSYQKYLNGIEALRLDLLGTLEAVKLEFIDNQIESTFFQGETAVEESLFAIKITPKAGGASTTFKGRSMVVYVRYPRSPTGWASIREIVQPAT
ncbi:YybH family protein [Tunturiibacter lichenicola]|jgi:ketosteroid isomerase-like protein|uniref:YybH family protein n=1 Tax=Tunturiibacter lichenicola TaxID=2051959 RepID=UPI003D9BE217